MHRTFARSRRRVTRWLLVVLPVAAIAVVLAVVAVYVVPRSAALTSTRASNARVIASMPYWTITADMADVLANRSEFTEASPWLYGLDSAGKVVPQYDRGDSAVPTALAQLRSAGLPIVPTIANVLDGNDFAYQPIADILHDPTRRAAHIADIVHLVTSNDYAGIDIDYEDLRGTDRQAFSDFVTELATALHAKGKMLSVAVFAKADDAGYDQRNQAQDYAAIGKAADQVRLMGYDYHWETSPPGPIAPVNWVSSVLHYAVTQIPAQRIVLGIPLYGYDWVGSTGTPIDEQQAQALASRYHATVRYDSDSQAPWFTYTDASGRQHTVWFENARSTQAKLGLARNAGLGGVFLWMGGPAGQDTWAALSATFPPSAAQEPR